MDKPTPPDHDVSSDELLQRVVYALLRPAVRIAAAFGMPLKALQRLADAAYFQETRRRTSTLRDAADHLDVSVRSAERLSKLSREAFLVPEQKHSLPRRIEFMLARAPMSEARLLQVLRDVDEADVRAALADLVGTERVTQDGERTITYRPSPGVRSLPRDTWVSRVGALASFGENLSNAAYGRFFAEDERAFARTLSFRLMPERVAALTELYQQTLLPQIVEWSDADEASEASVAMQLSLCWAPYDELHALEGAQDGETK